MAGNVEIATYVSDVMALERHILGPIEQQIRYDDVQCTPAVRDVLIKAQTVLHRQVADLEHLLLSLGGHPGADLKNAVSEVLGVAAAAVQSVRETKVSKGLRDDHTALSLTCLAYEMLYTSARVVHDDDTATIALQHLQQLSIVTMEVSEIIPGIVVKELLEKDPSLDGSVIDDVNRNIHETWKSGAREKQENASSESYATV